ncbi:YlxR family protein [Brevibacterium oceani]|uniref:YlxR family protein n=1 Tax=Brevibacterium oceani TaxID=358099 RepID=UPI002810B375|nr:YlxR family protein [Brevibacterium oceani]
MIRTTGPLGASRGAGAVESFIVNAGDGPVRTCIACRQKDDRNALTRFVFRPDQHPAVVHDVSATLPGRGAWVHPDEKCLTKARTTAAFARAFRTKITASDLPRPDTEPKENG